MAFYNYLAAVTEDVISWIREERPEAENRDALEETLNDDLWICDSVTGNGSGSYTFSRAKAREYVCADFPCVMEAMREFCVDTATLGEKMKGEEWEWLDVSTRCYYLGQAISQALDVLEGLGEISYTGGGITE